MAEEKNEVEESLDLPEVKEGEEDATDWKAEAQKLRDKAIAQRERTKAIKAELKEAKSKLEAKPEPAPQSNEPDYGKLAYLHARGLSHDEDIKIVNDEASRLKLSLNEVLSMPHIQSKLKTNQEVREAQEGMPNGSKHGSGKGIKDVDYWLAKGGLPENQELAEKVVEARMKQEKGSKFAAEMFS